MSRPTRESLRCEVPGRCALSAAAGQLVQGEGPRRARGTGS
jgi:hypothetical protein